MKGGSSRTAPPPPQPDPASPGGSHRGRQAEPCQRSWARGSRHDSRCPGCAQLAPSPPQAFRVDQPPLPEAPGCPPRKKLERMYSVDRVSGEGADWGSGSLLCSSKRQGGPDSAGPPGTATEVSVLPPYPVPKLGFTAGFRLAGTKSCQECFLPMRAGRVLRVEQAASLAEWKGGAAFRGPGGQSLPHQHPHQ